MRILGKNKKLPPLDWRTVILVTTFHVMVLFTPWCFSWSALFITLFLHWLIGSIGICLGFHRLLCHRSFQVPKFLEYALAILGTMALQAGPISWVSAHRRHHAHSEDIDKDPHSIRHGFWWSHMAWIFYRRPEFFDYEVYSKYAPDLARHPLYKWLDEYYLVVQTLLGLLLYALGGWSFVIYGTFLRTVLLWHSTWFVNSAAHRWGYRNFDTDDNARNLWWVSIMTYGEGWHNNHHAYPNVAKTGFCWWEVDITWWSIKALKNLGLAKKVVMPPIAASK
jgi:sn-2 palmitoyl-lipid 9-desaturase